MRVSILFVAVIAIVLCGCRRTGDFSAGFIAEISHYGGHVRTTNAIPEVRGAWSYKSDAQGFQVRLSGVPFSEIQAFMQQAYGTPVLVSTNLNGTPFGLYGAQDIGVAIQFFRKENSVEFICVRGQ